MRKVWDIHGGVHPPQNKAQSVQEPIGTIPLPDEFILPLNQHIGAPALPVVNVGDKVAKGQLVADAEGIFSACVHAPSSGEVVAIEPRVVAHPSGMTAPCIIIRPDGEEHWVELDPCPDFAALDRTELVARIRKAGLAGMGGAGFPTSVKLNPRSSDTIETMILNGTECEPYITSDDMLMREHAAGIVAGAQMLATIIGSPKDILIGIEDNKPEAIAAMRKAAQGTAIEVVVFPTKYPSGGERQLIQILTGKEVPSGKIPAEIGVLVQNVGTAYAAWRAVRYGEPLIERVTTVVGESLDRQRNIRVLIGTPVDHVLRQHGFAPKQAPRLIIGGPMMGFTIPEAQVPVVKITNCIIAPSHAEMPEPPPAQPCIRCGLCAEACPASLLPQQLYWYAQAEDADKLHSHNLFDCIECGACSYVCPSAIPLVQYYRAAKSTIRRQDAEKQKADRARLRFEQRQERVAKAEAEKEAKRAARRKAAEQAKQQLKDKESSTSSASDDPVARAMAKAQAHQDTPEVQRQKLERALSSSRSRVQRLQQQIAELEDTTGPRAEKLAASLKQAELKVEEAQKKLADKDKQPKMAPNQATTEPADKITER